MTFTFKDLTLWVSTMQCWGLEDGADDKGTLICGWVGAWELPIRMPWLPLTTSRSRHNLLNLNNDLKQRSELVLDMAL